MKDVKFSSFRPLNVEHLDEMPSSSSRGIELESPCSILVEVNVFHVIFYLNGVLVATRFEMVQNTRQ
jgi:hypothetical protein